MYAISFLDAKTLIQKETVSKTWRKLSKTAMRSKVFESKQELRDGVTRYCTFEAATMEEIAGTYGYPMDSWDVSKITDMSNLFFQMRRFNEYIGSWDRSKVTDMNRMF
jgi:surface protein